MSFHFLRNKKISFKVKVLIPLIIIFILSVLFITYIDYRMLSSAVRRKTNTNLEMFANNIITQINHLDIILGSAKQTLNEKHIAIAKTVVYILENTSQRIKPEELQYIAELLDISEINIANREGFIINSNIPEFIGDDYINNEITEIYMILADGTALSLSEEPRATIMPDSSLGSITHFTGITIPGGGFVQLGFNANVIAELQNQINIDKTINETRIGDNGYGFIISQGIITAHPDNAYLDRDVSGESWYKEVRNGSGFVWINKDNELYYAGFKNVNNNTIIGLVPRSDYYLDLNKILAETVRLLIFSITFIFIVMLLLLEKLLSPIKHLVYGLGKIAESNLNVRIEGNYNDEFDNIKDAVNSMADDIKEHMNLVSGIEYAAKIQKNLLPPVSLFNEAFEDYSCIWKPKDIVGGDIYWMKNFSEGTVLCVCDCTGHGTPGALLTMLVSSAFEAVVTQKNYKDTAEIIWELEKRLVEELNVDTNAGERGLIINDGCDLAVLFINKSGSVKISSGNTNVFICDGEKTKRFKGQKIRVGEGLIKNKDDIKTIEIPSNPDNKYYITSDGLYEQIGCSENGKTGKNETEMFPFGFARLEKIILENHKEKQSIISEKIFFEFEKFRGNSPRRDDLQLISFKPRIIS
ncbi:MAG: SpoIIE family protein phosphatase [Treponema sp.]|nr:SpoIIE family protein phosphatase [Treponema sp.]